MTAQIVPVKRNVLFHWANVNEISDLPGEVTLRGDEMVLDIPGGWGPYMIVGRLVEHRFEGTSAAHGRSKHTEARWADVGNSLYVGVWIEDNEEFLFSFEFRV